MGRRLIILLACLLFATNAFAAMYFGGNGNFGTVNTTTGEMTIINSNWFEDVDLAIVGSDGTLAASANGTLYIITDPTTGAFTGVISAPSNSSMASSAVAILYINMNGELDSFDGSSFTKISDFKPNAKIAFDSTNLFASDDGFFGTVNVTTGECTAILNDWPKKMFITCDSAGTMYGACDGFFGTINTTTGARTTITSNFPGNTSIVSTD